MINLQTTEITHTANHSTSELTQNQQTTTPINLQIWLNQTGFFWVGKLEGNRKGKKTAAKYAGTHMTSFCSGV